METVVVDSVYCLLESEMWRATVTQRVFLLSRVVHLHCDQTKYSDATHSYMRQSALYKYTYM